MIGFLNPVLEKEWGISLEENALLASSIFLSWGLGNLFCSFYSDKLGRLVMLKFSVLGILIFGFLSAFSQNIWQLIFFRFILCLLMGMSAPLFVPLLGEISPAKGRGERNVLMDFGFVLGSLVTILLAYFCLDSIDEGNWRKLIFLNSILILIPFVGIWFFGIESPRFLFLKGDFKQAIKILN